MKRRDRRDKPIPAIISSEPSPRIRAFSFSLYGKLAQRPELDCPVHGPGKADSCILCRVGIK